MAERFKVYRHPETGEWLIHQYNTAVAHRVLTQGYAVGLITQPNMKDWPTLGTIEMGTLRQEEDTCPECGRRLESENGTHPGGGGWFQDSCTNCDYSYGDSF